jgi:hypothetical protein
MSSANEPDNVKAVRDHKTYLKPKLVIYGQVKAMTGAITRGGPGDGAGMRNSSMLLKQNVVCIGKHPAGFGIYLFNYKPEFRDSCGHGRKLGVIAEEVERVMPEAVSMAENGFKCVDYPKLGIRLPGNMDG